MKKTALAIAMIAIVFMMGCQNNAPEPDVSVPPETSGGGSESKAYSIKLTSSSRGISDYRSMTVILRDNSKADVVLVFSDDKGNECLEKFTDADVVNTEGNLTIDLKDSGGAEAGTVILAIDESSSVLSATLKIGESSSFYGNATVLEDIKAPVSSESYSGTLFFGPSDNGSTAMTIEFKALEPNGIVITLYTNQSSDKEYSLYSPNLKGQEVLQYSNFWIGNDAEKLINTLGGTYRFAPDEDGNVVFYDKTNEDLTYHMTRIM